MKLNLMTAGISFDQEHRCITTHREFNQLLRCLTSEFCKDSLAMTTLLI